MFALIWIEKQKKLVAVNGSGRAPKLLSVQTTKKAGLEIDKHVIKKKWFLAFFLNSVQT